jgi:hypothetical protein
MNRRRTLIIILLAALAALGGTLWLGTRESTSLRLSRPTTSTLPTAKQASAEVEAVSATTFLEKPRYGGEDDSGQRWRLTADRAQQAGTVASSTFLLQNLAADWITADSQTFLLTATDGEYEPATQNLTLTGTVSATGGGMEILTPAATANLKTRQVSGTQGVQVNGTMGSQPAVLNAQSFTLDAAGERLTFRGKVKLVLEGSQQ